MIVVGRAGQDTPWLANNTQGWIWHLSDFRRLPELLQDWRAARTDDIFRPYGYGTFFELMEDPDAPLRYARGLQVGRNQLIELWKRQEEQGVSHVALNLKPNRRPVEEIMQELKEYVLPHFSGQQAMAMTA